MKPFIALAALALCACNASAAAVSIAKEMTVYSSTRTNVPVDTVIGTSLGLSSQFMDYAKTPGGYFGRAGELGFVGPPFVASGGSSTVPFFGFIFNPLTWSSLM